MYTYIYAMSASSATARSDSWRGERKFRLERQTVERKRQSGRVERFEATVEQGRPENQEYLRANDTDATCKPRRGTSYL